MKKRGNEIAESLKVPMLECLVRIISELEEKFEYWNKLVMTTKGIDLDLKLISAYEADQGRWVVEVEGSEWIKGDKIRKVFTVIWRSDTCPAHFHILEKGRSAWENNLTDLYRGLIEPTSSKLAKKIATLTHGRQIPPILEN